MAAVCEDRLLMMLEVACAGCCWLSPFSQPSCSGLMASSQMYRLRVRERESERERES